MPLISILKNIVSFLDDRVGLTLAIPYQRWEKTIEINSDQTDIPDSKDLAERPAHHHAFLHAAVC